MLKVILVIYYNKVKDLICLMAHSNIPRHETPQEMTFILHVVS